MDASVRSPRPMVINQAVASRITSPQMARRRRSMPATKDAIHFEDVDREVPQVPERRVAGAEVVEREAEAQAPSSCKVRATGSVSASSTLGELQDQDWGSRPAASTASNHS